MTWQTLFEHHYNEIAAATLGTHTHAEVSLLAFLACVLGALAGTGAGRAPGR